MKKILLLIISVSALLASEGVPVLSLPDFAQDGYMPSSPVYKEKGITFSYASWYLGTNYTSIITELDNIEFGFKGLLSSNIEIRGDVPTDTPVGTTQYYNSALFINKHWYVSDKWAFKAGLNLINEHLFVADSWGGAVNAEAIRKFNVNTRILAGVENLGWMSPLGSVGTNLPTRYYVGGDLIFNFLIVSLEAGINNDIDPYLRWSVRYFHPVFEITYSHDTLLKIHHVGADLKLSDFRIGYGQYFHSRGIGNPMMLSFGMVF